MQTEVCPHYSAMNIFQIKEQALTDTPLLVFDCELANGQAERWSTHQVTIAGNVYSARVLPEQSVRDANGVGSRDWTPSRRFP